MVIYKLENVKIGKLQPDGSITNVKPLAKTATLVAPPDDSRTVTIDLEAFTFTLSTRLTPLQLIFFKTMFHVNQYGLN